MIKKKTLGITQRVYLWVSAIIIFVTVIVIIVTSINTAQLRRLEYEKQLYIISGMLGGRLNESFDAILVSKGTVNKPVEEQVRVLNSVLQPIVDDILKEYPTLGAGYYSIRLDHNLAIQPNFSPDKLISLPHSRPFFVVYETGKPILTTVSSSISWGSPILNYTSPLYDKNGVIFGHSWANVNLHDMYVEIIRKDVEILFGSLIVMVSVLFTMRRVFNRLSQEVREFAVAIVDNKPDLDLQLLPELKPIFKKIKDIVEEKQAILNSMTDCFYVINGNWELTYVNSAAEIVFGKSCNELLGKKLTELFKANDITVENFQKVMSEKKPKSFELISEALGKKWIEVSAYPAENGGLTCYFRDISSRKMAEQEIARLDRLNLVGQMAAGIGHEIRNPITTIRGYLQLLGAKPDYAAQKSIFELMISEIDRANSIITEFLSLAQTKESELKVQNLNDIINNLYPLLEADTFTQNKQISFFPGEIPNLELNGKEISQVILNLVRNGLEAMGERGLLIIKSYFEDDKVVIEIIDEGCGISIENINMLGTPFFTTKDHGTGLGLATCYKIAESHKAKIKVNSSSSGTTFLIFFPIPECYGALA